jgi:hypothetical protein
MFNSIPPFSSLIKKIFQSTQLMSTIVLIFFFILSNSFSAIAQQNREAWYDVSESSIKNQGNRLIIPQEYRTLFLNKTNLIEILNQAPKEFSNDARSRKVYLNLPYPNGESKRFYILNSPIMEPGLAIKYPEIRTFIAQGVDEPSSNARLDLTPQGFHAIIFSEQGTIYIDPYSQNSSEYYISYFKKNYFSSQSNLFSEIAVLGTDSETAREISQLVSNGVELLAPINLRTYRLACATTGEYTAFHGGTIPLGLTAVVTAINRVNGIYEREVAVRMVLIANNDTLIYTNASTDPYTNNNGSTMLGQNQSNLNAVIGSANYDIGHVFSTGGGGIAYLGCVCTSSKAGGVTGLSSPIGDPFYVDYVAHEMGHQFGANHSFNGNAGSCSGGNRNASTAYEPGSGSTIMAYAGICSPQDLQNFSDDYFHLISIIEIVAFTTSGSGNSCPTITATSNNAPVVTVPSGGFTIPISTPFSLTGSATDSDNDPLTFCWEEWDLGPAGAPNTPSGTAPIFRSFKGTSNPTRIFPKVSNLINNTQTIGEILPSYTRNLNFRLTARDNKFGGGGFGYSSVGFSANSAAGPFQVTSPNTAVSWDGLSNQTVTWNVANTNTSPVNCANVKIMLSTDGGLTFPITVLASTPNDGSETVIVPNNPTSTARIKVEATDNIFFDISNVNFTINNAVPVELTLFIATYQTTSVKLEWATATETNNSGFEIQRKVLSQQSAISNSEFKTIGFTAGHGTTTQTKSYTFIDNNLLVGKHLYRLKQIDFDGAYEFSNEIEVYISAPKNYSLEQNYPNPFNPTTSIQFSLPTESDVVITLYNSLGQEVQELVNRSFSAGLHHFNFDASSISSGVYHYRIQAKGNDGSIYVSFKKMILLK